jgi:hypothetical protein
MNQDISLDDLYREAKAAMRGQQAKLAKAPVKAEATPSEGIYANPANWIRGQVICLLHKETQSFLGYYVEWRHRTVPDARRLVREVGVKPPTESCSVEYLSGQWPAEVQTPPERKLPWKIDLPCVASIKLLDFGLEAVGVPLDFCFGEGRLDRVELVVTTTFRSPGQYITLPSGTDILPRMLPVQVQDLLTQLGQA